MDLFAEDLHPRLREVFREFDSYCKKHAIFYSIESDEDDKQGYLIKKEDAEKVDNLIDYIQNKIEDQQVHLHINREHENGILLTFSTVYEEGAGHWDVVKGHPGKMGGADKKGDRSQYTIFARPEDAKKVRAGKMPIQKAGNIEAKKASFEEKLDLALWNQEVKSEDQYKSPTGKHRRNQSAFRSSFGRSRTFGGRTNGPSHKKESFGDRLGHVFSEDMDAAESEAMREILDLVTQYTNLAADESTDNGKEEIWGELLSKFDSFKNTAISDDAKNISGEFFDAVSNWNADQRFASGEGQNWDIDPNSLTDIQTKIVELQNKHVHGSEEEPGLKPAAPNMRPIGLFGPGDKRQPEGTPPSSGRNKLLRMGERGQLGNI